MYPGVVHAFNIPSSSIYTAQATADAEQSIIKFLELKIKQSPHPVVLTFYRLQITLSYSANLLKTVSYWQIIVMFQRIVICVLPHLVSTFNISVN